MDDIHKRARQNKGMSTNGIEIRLIPLATYQAKMAANREKMQARHDEEVEERRLGRGQETIGERVEAKIKTPLSG